MNIPALVGRIFEHAAALPPIEGTLLICFLICGGAALCWFAASKLTDLLVALLDPRPVKYHHLPANRSNEWPPHK